MRCTSDFATWIDKLDRSLAIRIDQRIQRLVDGNPGFHRRFDGLLELKWRTGAIGSYRVYCFEYEGVVLLLGGSKGSQKKDIEEAKRLKKGVIDGSIGTQVYE